MFNEEQYWNERYKSQGDSGYGSYNDQLQKKLEWLKGLDIASITEIGCGDFNFGRNLLLMYPNARYMGQDQSEFIIKKNSELYPYAQFTTGKTLPTADLVLCIDVLFHIHDEKKVEAILDALKPLSHKYIAVTAYERDQKEGLAPHVCIRKFDYTRFGKPIIREVVEEDGQLYFYLFENDRSKTG